MNKRNKIIYWVATAWLSLGMISTGTVQLIHQEEEVQKMTALGDPLYFLTIIGAWKILGAVVILIPNYPLVKEWAYAGFMFLMSGAILSHLAVGDNVTEYFGPTLLLVLTIISWLYRPGDRKIISKLKINPDESRSRLVF
jgi:hypothetical protein